jgi:flagellar basal body-associated protein FliL
MAEAHAAGDKAAGDAKAGGRGKLGWIITAVVAGGLGTVVPYVLPDSFKPGSSHAAEEVAHVEAPPSPAEVSKPAYIDFGRAVVNLDEGRFNRYLQVTIWLQVHEKERDEINTNVTANKVVLQNWLLSYLSDQNLEDVRGAIGQNRLRREIRDQFNTILFPDGYDRIEQVLFQEFVVQ